MRRRTRIHHASSPAQIEADVAAVLAHGPYDASRGRAPQAASHGPAEAAESINPLAATILPPGDRRLGVGRESGRLRNEGISRHDDPYGSTRYLYSMDGAIVSGLQVVSHDGRDATIANVYTRPAFRGRRLAAELLAQARADFARVHHADEPHLSAAGRGWRDAMESRRRGK